MRLQRRVAVIGAGMTKFGQLFDSSFFDLIAEAYLSALGSVDESLDPHNIEAGWLSTVMKNPIHGSALTHATGLEGMAVTRVENMCSSGSDAFRNAVYGVAAGAFDLALVVGAEKMSEPDFEAGGACGAGVASSDCRFWVVCARLPWTLWNPPHA